MTTFVAIYSGETVGDARLVALSAEPGLVQEVAERLLHGWERPADPVGARRADRCRAALRIIRQGARDAAE